MVFLQVICYNELQFRRGKKCNIHTQWKIANLSNNLCWQDHNPPRAFAELSLGFDQSANGEMGN